MLVPPLPNFTFQRDSSRWIYGGVTLNPMAKPARKPETMIVEAIYRFHPMFGPDGGVEVGSAGRPGLGQGHHRGRRRHADRQRHRADRHGRAHHPRQAVSLLARRLFRRSAATVVLAVVLPVRATTCTSTR